MLQTVADRLRDAAVQPSDAVLRQWLAATGGALVTSAVLYVPLRDISREVCARRATNGTTAANEATDEMPSSSSPLSTLTALRGRAGAAPQPSFRRSVKNFLHLLKIAFPRFRSQQGKRLVVLTAMLVVRTQLSLVIASKLGDLASTLVRADKQAFLTALCIFFLWTIPAAIVNSLIKYLTTMLQISLRDKLGHYLHGKYMQPRVFFRLAGLPEACGGMGAIEQRMTQDVQRWANQTASLYTVLFKPLIDIVLFSRNIASLHQGSYRGPLAIGLYYAVVSVVVRAMAPPFGLLSALQTEKDTALRQQLGHELEYAREIALCQGQDTERKRVQALFDAASKQTQYTAAVRSWSDVLDGLLARHGSIMVGTAVCGWIVTAYQQPLPASTVPGGVGALTSVSDMTASAARTALFVQSSTMLTNLARAVGQVLLAYRSVSYLMGHTQRVHVVDDAMRRAERHDGGAEMPAVPDDDIGAHEKRVEGRTLPLGYSCSSNIAFENVTLRTPPIVNADGDEIPPDPSANEAGGVVLCRNVTFAIKPGMNLLVTGPNGCGKSSLFRMLAELWPLPDGGAIAKPSREQLYYVSQKPYMSAGTFRDQIIYPTRYKDLKVGESELLRCLTLAGLDDILDRPNVSWDSNLIWSGEALSMGEKQKLALARMFYHRPRYAILDECTSAIDLETEERIYRSCQSLGITVMSIAHRRSVWPLHNWVLRFDGAGRYVFGPMKVVVEGASERTPMGSSNSTLQGTEASAAAPRTYLVVSNIASASDAALVGTTLRELIDGDETEQLGDEAFRTPMSYVSTSNFATPSGSGTTRHARQ